MNDTERRTGRGPVFLERSTYRQRRLIDALRLLPVVGLLLWAVPLLWSGGGTTPTSAAILYIFGVWFGLVVVAALMARGVGRSEADGVERVGEDAGQAGN